MVEAGVIVCVGRLSLADGLEVVATGAGEVDATKVMGVSVATGFGVSRARRAGAETYKPKLSRIKPHAMRNSLLMFMGAL